MKRFRSILILVGYLLLAGLTLYIVDYMSKSAIEGALIRWMPWTLRLNFLLLLAGLLLWIIRDRAPIFCGNRGSVPNYRNFIPAILALGAFLAVLLLPPQIHRLFYDEDIYANIGQNIAVLNQAALCNYGAFTYGEYLGNWLQYNKEPNGWPFLISLVFQMTGVDESRGFLLNNLLFVGSTLVVYAICRLLTPRRFPAILAALAYAVIPHNLIWSSTVAAEPAAAFFSGLAVLFLLTFLRTGQTLPLYLLAVTLPLACQMRAESGLIAVWTGAALLLLAPRTFREGRLWALGLLSFLLLLPHLLHLYAMSGQSWGAEGAKFAFSFLSGNLAINGPYYLNNELFPVVVTLLALAGCIGAPRGSRLRVVALLLWFVLFWGIFLFFYAGSYRYGTDVRFALTTFMPLAILAGLGGGVLRDGMVRIARRLGLGATEGEDPGADGGKGRASLPERFATSLILLIFLFFWIPFLPMIRTVGQEAWAARHDHAYAMEFARKMPERSIVLTHNPTMFLLWGKSAIQAHVGLTDRGLVRELMKRYPGHVYFHYNFWCNTVNDPNRKLCADILSSYETEEVASGQEQEYRYALYRLNN